jgi:2-aminoadipate transaminase
VYGHLVAVEVGVECGTDQWVQLDGLTFDQFRFEGLDAQALLPLAVARGVAFVPGAPFYAEQPELRSLRLSFVTPDLPDIERGVAALAAAIDELTARLN